MGALGDLLKLQISINFQGWLSSNIIFRKNKIDWPLNPPLRNVIQINKIYDAFYVYWCLNVKKKNCKYLSWCHRQPGLFLKLINLFPNLSQLLPYTLQILQLFQANKHAFMTRANCTWNRNIVIKNSLPEKR